MLALLCTMMALQTSMALLISPGLPELNGLQRIARREVFVPSSQLPSSLLFPSGVYFAEDILLLDNSPTNPIVLVHSYRVPTTAPSLSNPFAQSVDRSLVNEWKSKQANGLGVTTWLLHSLANGSELRAVGCIGPLANGFRWRNYQPSRQFVLDLSNSGLASSMLSPLYQAMSRWGLSLMNSSPLHNGGPFSLQPVSFQGSLPLLQPLGVNSISFRPIPFDEQQQLYTPLAAAVWHTQAYSTAFPADRSISEAHIVFDSVHFDASVSMQRYNTLLQHLASKVYGLSGSFVPSSCRSDVLMWFQRIPCPTAVAQAITVQKDECAVRKLYSWSPCT